jgi:DNA-binding PadR family transcriptional regulator
MRSALLKGHLDALVLAVLADGPAHGYSILTALRVRTGGAIDLQGGSLYPTLRRLEATGLVASAWAAEHGRQRRVYTIREKGLQQLESERGDWTDFVNALEPLLGPPVRLGKGRG